MPQTARGTAAAATWIVRGRSHATAATRTFGPDRRAPQVSTPDQEARLAVYLSDALFDARDPAEVEKAAALDVLVVETAAGASSDHLPEVYRGLFAAA